MYLLFSGIILIPFLTLVAEASFLRLAGEIQEPNTEPD
jgi:hypothetical protein